MATQTLTIDGAGTTTSGWGAEGGDYTRLQSDDGDTSRLYSPTNNDVYQCTLSNTTGLTGATINSITVHAKVKSLDPVSNTMQIGIRTNSTDYYSSNKDTNPNNTTYIDFTETWSTNPNTGLAWTTSDLDALQMGLKKTNGAGMRWSYGYVEVDYTEGGGGSPVSVTPGLATLTITSFAPTVSVTNNQSVTPGQATLTATRNTPTVTASDHKIVTPGVATLTITRNTPTATASNHQIVTPGVLALTITRNTPIVTASDNKSVTPGTLALTLSGLAPVVSATANQVISPDATSLIITPQAPSVSVTGGQIVVPGFAALILTSFIPVVSLSDHRTVTPGTRSLTLTAYNPSITAGSSISITPGVLAIALSAFGPTISVDPIVFTDYKTRPIMKPVSRSHRPRLAGGFFDSFRS